MFACVAGVISEGRPVSKLIGWGPNNEIDKSRYAHHQITGSCEDATVLCAQLCLKLNEDTYECSCWNDHILQPDGVGCRCLFETSRGK